MKWQPKWSQSVARWQPKWRDTVRTYLTVPDNCVIDRETRYTGKVTTFFAKRGVGFIELAQQGLIPNNRVWVFRNSIVSEDRIPTLEEGQEVEFCLLRVTEGAGPRKRTTLRTRRVTLPGGARVDAPKEFAFVGGPHVRYTGTLQYYRPRQGFGMVTIDEGYSFEEQVPSEIRVEEKEVNCGGKKPSFIEKLSVEFGIIKTSASNFTAHNLTLPGGKPLAKQNFENRQMVGDQMFHGYVSYYNWSKNWGYITPDDLTEFPQEVAAMFALRATQLVEQGKDPEEACTIYFRNEDTVGDFWPEQDMEVSFMVYTDIKGVGACQVFAGDLEEAMHYAGIGVGAANGNKSAPKRVLPPSKV